MIVQCTNCRARFRVADDKVPDRGVKVRCTKCATVFRVTKADAVDAKPGASRDPFGLDTGRQTPMPGSSTPLPGGTGPQRQASPFDGIDLTGPIVSQTGPQSRTGPQQREGTPASASVPRLANFPQSVSLTYGAASPHQTLDLELSLGPPSPSSATIPVGPSPMGAGNPFAAMPPPPAPPPPSSASVNAIDAALSAAMGLPDPFADLNLGSAPPRNYTPPPAAPVDPFADMNQAPSYGMPPQAPPGGYNDPFAVDFGAPNPAHAAMPTPMPTMPDPFAMSAGPSGSYARPPPQPPRPPAPAAPPAGDPWMNLLKSQPKKEETDPFAGMDAPLPEPQREASVAPIRPPEPPREPTAEPSQEPAGGLRVTGTGEFEMEATRGHKLDLDYGPGSELEGFQSPEPPKQPKKEKEKEKESASREALEIGRIQLGKSESDDDKPKVADQKALARAKLRRELASAVFNVACACVVLYSGIVAVAWVRTPRPIGLDDVGFPMVWLALGADGKDPGDQLRASQVKSGIYPTRGGGELFYVEGLAHNGSSARQEALYAQVEIRRGDHVVERTDALAQLKATPEHLWALDSRKNDDLQKALVKETSSLEVDSHNVAPFIAVFKLTAKDVEGCDVRVTIHPGVPATLQSVVGPVARTPAPAPEGTNQEEGSVAPSDPQVRNQ